MKILIVTCLFISAVCAVDESPSFVDCLEKDSISCIQNSVYRQAKSFFDQPKIDIFGGVSLLAKSERAGKSLDEPTVDIGNANTVENRENALESYVINRATNFFQERSLKWDFANTARALANVIPDGIKESVREFVTEGRCKGCSLLKKLLPLLAIFKFKLSIFKVLALFAIGIIAKKALIFSAIAIGLSGLAVFKGLLSKVGGGVSGLGGLGGLGGVGGLGGLGGLGGGSSVGYSGGSSGGYSPGSSGGYPGGSGGGYPGGSGGAGSWSSGGASNGGWSSGGYGSYSEPIPQSIAYSGHHKVARR